MYAIFILSSCIHSLCLLRIPVRFVEKLASMERQSNVPHSNVTKADLQRAKKSYEAAQEELAQAHFSRRNVS